MPKAGKGEVVIKNHAVAVNPVDCGFVHNCWLFDYAD
jgi:NADPH:quinone reductase-like Zn-dependent oxidoreductase